MKPRKDQAGIDGEKATEEIALKVFYGEFVFSDLWFSHKDIGTGTNRQLADLIINIGNDLLAFEVKTRNGGSTEEGDKKWVKEKIKDAKGQLVNTFNDLQVNGLPSFVNKKGDAIFLEKQGIFSGIIILKNDKVFEYPKIIKCNRLNGIMHCFTENDFDICCQKLVIPKDILEYLFFRERYYQIDSEVKEPETICIGKFLVEKYGTDLFGDNSLDSFKWILNHFKEKLIEKDKHSIEYREIIQVLATFDRLYIDTFSKIFGELYNGAKQGVFVDHMFIKPENQDMHSVLFISQKVLDKKHASRLTHLFKYISKIEKCLTVILCIENETEIEVDWLLVEYKWKKDLMLEHMIKELGIQNKWFPRKKVYRQKRDLVQQE